MRLMHERPYAHALGKASIGAPVPSGFARNRARGLQPAGATRGYPLAVYARAACGRDVLTSSLRTLMAWGNQGRLIWHASRGFFLENRADIL